MYLSGGAGREAVPGAWPGTKATVARASVLGCAGMELKRSFRKEKTNGGVVGVVLCNSIAKHTASTMWSNPAWAGSRKIGVAVRYEKLATNYLGMLKLAIIHRHLCAPFSNRA